LLQEIAQCHIGAKPFLEPMLIFKRLHSNNIYL